MRAADWTSAMRLVNDPVLLLDREGHVLAQNRTAERRFGPTVVDGHVKAVLSVENGRLESFLHECADSADPLPARLVLHVEDAGELQVTVDARGARVELDGGSAVALWLVRPGDSVHAFLDLNDRVDDLLGELLHRRAAERALREQEERFRLAFDVSLLGMAIESLHADSLGRIVRVNDELCRMLGRPASEILGRSALDFAAADEHLFAGDVFAALARGDIDRWQGERHFSRPDGTEVWALVRKGRASTAGGGPGYLITHFEDITARRTAETQLMHQALHDQLTGLPNRTLLLDHMEGALARGRRESSSVGLLFLDLDDFKLVNDTLGHAAGDEVLVAVAQRMATAARESDTVARLGGDEFVLLCEGLTDPEEGQVVARRVLSAIEQPLVVQDREITPSASIGLAFAEPTRTITPGKLMSEADAALYDAKGKGKRQHATYTEDLRRTALRQFDLAAQLRRALDREELVLDYQPVVDLADRRILGAEALVRWQHPQRGLLAPDAFIDIAERSDLIVDLGAWVLGTAVAQARDWQERDRATGRAARRLSLAVNVSVRQVTSGRLRGQVERALAAGTVAPGELQLELTESQFMTASESSRREMAALAELGVVLSLDDFGTGYSSLSALKGLPFGIVKLDRSYVSGIGSDRADEAIVQAVLVIAEALGLTCIAEGIETEEQAAFLLAHGCQQGQGFLFSRPVPGASFPHAG